MELPENLISRVVHVKDRPVHYVMSPGETEGAADVVLVHGVGLSHRYMLPTAKRLAGEFRVFVPDLPGFGKSYKSWHVFTLAELADALNDWMEAISLEQAMFLGNSVGCQIIVQMAVRHPERVRCAILQGPTVDPEARTMIGQFKRWHQNRKTETGQDKGPIVIKDYWECGPWRLYRTFRYAINDPMEENLPKMHCPTLVVRGHRDPIVSQEWAEEVARLLPQEQLLVLEGNVSHTANFEAPEELVAAVTPFLRENADRSPSPTETPSASHRSS